MEPHTFWPGGIFGWPFLHTVSVIPWPYLLSGLDSPGKYPSAEPVALRLLALKGA